MPRSTRAQKRRAQTNPSRSTRGARWAASGLWWRAAIIVIAGSLTYLNSISNPFIFDDAATIVDNEQIRELGDLSSVLTPARELPVAGRPVANISFAINYATGGLAPTGYRLWNIAVHLLCGLLLFGVVRRTLTFPDRRATPSDRSTNLAFAAALLWVVHPLASEPVYYLTQRTESMMALFYLLTDASARTLTSPRKMAWEITAVVACALGMGCKESMVTAPVMIVLYDRIFVFSSFREAFRKRRWLYFWLAATWLILAGLLSTGPRRRSAGFSTGLSPWTYLLNQPSLLTRYLRLSVWPSSLVASYGWPRPITLGDVAHLTLGIQLIQDQKLDEAVAEIRAFIREQPHLAQVVDARMYLGSIFTRQQRWREAIAE
jgi:hypothetical protein